MVYLAGGRALAELGIVAAREDAVIDLVLLPLLRWQVEEPHRVLALRVALVSPVDEELLDHPFKLGHR